MWRFVPNPGRAILPALLAFLAFSALADGDSEASPALDGPATLQVLDTQNDVLAQLPLTPGEAWCLAWNHSVTGIEVLDCYRYRDGRMVLERSHQPDFAAGLGHIIGRGVQVSDGEGGYWIEHIDEPVPGNRYLLRVGSPAVDHRLVQGDSVTSLSALAAGERVLIRLRARNES